MKVYKGRSGESSKKRTETEFCVKDRSVSVLFILGENIKICHTVRVRQLK